MQQQAESITKKICIRIRWGPKLINGSVISMEKTSYNMIKTQSRVRMKKISTKQSFKKKINTITQTLKLDTFCTKRAWSLILKNDI